MNEPMQTILPGVERQLPPRPTMHDEAAITRAAEKLLPGVLRWLHQANGKEDDRPEEILDDLRDVLDGAFDLDGYSLAKELDSRHYWSCSSGLVDELDDAFHFSLEAVDDLTRIWVKDNGVTTKYAIGDTVHFQQRDCWHQGEVVSLYPDLGKMVVFVEALGHVTKGNGTTGTYVDFEKAHDARPA